MDYNIVYEKYYKKVHIHVSKILKSSDIDDIVQEIFIKISQGLPNFQGKSKISTWIHKITINHCIDIKRKRKAIHSYINSTIESEYIEDTPCDCEGIESKLIKTEMNNCIKKYILLLPECFGDVVMLRDIEGFSNKEIAEKLSIPIDLVKIRLHRGRLKLKNILIKQCCFFYNENNLLACIKK